MRIGLALSDPLGLTAQGLPTLEAAPEPLAAVLEVIREHEVSLVVLGHPINMDGTRGRAARTAEVFAQALRAAGVPVELADERLTTEAAHRALAAGGVKGKRRKAHVDRLAAQLILQSFLDRPR